MSTERVALDVFTDIVYNEAYANLALTTALDILQVERDKRFVRALVYTTLEHLSYIDYVVAHFAKGKQSKPIKNIIRLGACQLLFMNRQNSAVCNESVKLTREIGKSALSGYVNGVLRNVCRASESGELPALPKDPIQSLTIETGYPEWLVKEYIQRFGVDETRKILTYRAEGVFVRAQYPYTSHELETWCLENGIAYSRGGLDSNVFKLSGVPELTQSELFTTGCITIQSESSAVVCRTCGVTSGMQVLDACAAPGGKSAYLASLSKNTCNITACELHEHRKVLLDNTFKRLHVTCATAECRDMTVECTEFAEKFDVVLCDVPCSGLGVVGKPDIRYKKDAHAIDDITAVQQAILANCSTYVKHGGVLVYSTCTVSERENENVIESFLGTHVEFTPDDSLAELLPQHLHNRIENGMLHLLPSKDGTDGFFIAKLRRKDF